MIGSGVLQSCLEDADVEKILAVGRQHCGRQDPKLKEIILKDFSSFETVEPQLRGYNTSLFALGVSSFGMNEAAYGNITYDLTLTAAETLLKLNPNMSFCYVSGQGTDSTEKGSIMWARVKGRIENKLLSMNFKPAVMFRPGGIKPLKGVRSKTRLYRFFYALLGPLLTLFLPVFPKYITTSERLGRAMLKAARGLADKPVLESVDINRLGI